MLSVRFLSMISIIADFFPRNLYVAKNCLYNILLITTKFLEFVHRPDFYKQKTKRFGNWISLRLQARGGGGGP
jgi:hypothetical protein